MTQHVHLTKSVNGRAGVQPDARSRRASSRATAGSAIGLLGDDIPVFDTGRFDAYGHPGVVQYWPPCKVVHGFSQPEHRVVHSDPMV